MVHNIVDTLVPDGPISLLIDTAYTMIVQCADTKLYKYFVAYKLLWVINDLTSLDVSGS